MKNKLERLTRIDSLRRWETYDLDGPVDALIEELQHVKAEAARDGYWDLRVQTEWDYDHTIVYIWAERMETDEEYQERCDAEEARLARKRVRAQKQRDNIAKKAKLKEDQERALLAELLAKYGSD